MPKLKFDHQALAAIPAPDKPVEYYDTLESGLILRVSKAGTKSFEFRYRFGGKSRRLKIGTFPGVSLAEARRKTQRYKVAIHEGTDPQAEILAKRRQPGEDPKTWRQAIDAYKEKHLPTLKESTRQDYEYRINHLIKGEGRKKTKARGFTASRYIKDIQRYEALDLLESIARTSPVQAQRVQALLSGIFKFALNRGWVEMNIASGINFSDRRKKRRKKWQNSDFDDQQIKKLWEAFDLHEEPSRSFFKLLLILGQRAGETRKMKWADVDFDGQIWTIPAADTKNGLTHHVPLPEMALDILEALRPHTGAGTFVFESQVKKGEPIGHLQKTAQRIRERHGVTEFNIHSLRTTVATRLAGLGIAPQVLSKILNHKKPGEGSMVTAIYNKYDYESEKRQALRRWTDLLKQIIDGQTGTRIHQIA